MTSLLVTAYSKGTNPKTTLYVGGLDEGITDAILHAAFIPFGDVKDISIPIDHATGKNRGFGFVEYEEKEDAHDAIDNLHNAELYGKVLKVNFAQPMKIKGGDKGWAHQPVWADADKYMDEVDAEKEAEDLNKEEGTAATPADKAAAADPAAVDPMAAMEAAIAT